MEGRKIDIELDDPINTILLSITEPLNPYFRTWDFTPNMITTISLLFGLMMLYFYHLENYILIYVISSLNRSVMDLFHYHI